MVADALDEIPPALGAEMENVAVVVEDWPNAAQPARLAPGSTLLGLYEGVPITRRGPLSYSRRRARSHHDLPRAAVALARDDDDLAAQVRVTVLHEVGHYFGMTTTARRAGLGLTRSSRLRCRRLAPCRTPTT